MVFYSARQRRKVMAMLRPSYGGEHRVHQSIGTGERYITTKPIMRKKISELLDKSSDILSLVPEPTAQKASYISKIVSVVGKNVKIRETKVPVRGYKKQNGKYVKSHRRTIKKKITI